MFWWQRFKKQHFLHRNSSVDLQMKVSEMRNNATQKLSQSRINPAHRSNLSCLQCKADQQERDRRLPLTQSLPTHLQKATWSHPRQILIYRLRSSSFSNKPKPVVKQVTHHSWPITRKSAVARVVLKHLSMASNQALIVPRLPGWILIQEPLPFTRSLNDLRHNKVTLPTTGVTTRFSYALNMVPQPRQPQAWLDTNPYSINMVRQETLSDWTHLSRHGRGRPHRPSLLRHCRQL